MKFVIPACAALATVVSGVPAARAAAVLPGYFSGGANAAMADASAMPLTFELTHTAGQGCPCAGSNGTLLSDEVGPVRVPGLFSVKATRATSESDRGAKESTATQTALVTGLSLFDGRIVARTIHAVASIDATESALKMSTDGSRLGSLVIDGKAVPENVAPNTRMHLAGVGTITIYEVTKTGDDQTTAGVQVRMIDVEVTTKNALGLPVGAHITVGDAGAGYTRTPLHKVVSGDAFIATASTNLAGLLPDFGNYGELGIGDCSGTGGKTEVLHTVADNVPGVIDLGAGSTRVRGVVNQKQDSGLVHTSAKIANVSLLNGLIHARSVVAFAEESLDGDQRHDPFGATLTKLVVAGIAIPVHPSKNTTIPLPGIGTLVVNEQTRGNPLKNQGDVVNALDLTVTEKNVFGLPVGAEIIIAHAAALTRPLD